MIYDVMIGEMMFVCCSWCYNCCTLILYVANRKSLLLVEMMMNIDCHYNYYQDYYCCSVYVDVEKKEIAHLMERAV